MEALGHHDVAHNLSNTVYLTLFGSFRAKVGNQILPALNADKAIALLVYLVIQNQPHRREILAALFWPEMTERRARENLSQAIYTLRKTLGASLLLTDARIAQLNPAFSLDCDLWQLNFSWTGCSVHYPTFAEECQTCWDKLQRGLDACQDEFLAGFSLHDCPEFEAWLRTQRLLYSEQKSSALKKLVDRFWQQKKSVEALATIQKVVKLDPYDEEAQLVLLQLLLYQGQRNAALTAFGRYQQLIQTELDSQPSAQLLHFYQQILASTGQQNLPLSHSLHPQPPIVALPFVGRRQELSRLHACLGKALAGSGQIIFVTGEAGFGKSALLQTFAQQAQSHLPNLLVAKGNCNAYTGIGDPYLPMREILACLTGDVEAHRRLTLLSPYPATTWHKIVSITIQSLIESAPDLIGTLLAPAALLARAETVLPQGKLLEKLRKLVAQKEREKEVAYSNGRPQSALFDQITRLLQCLTHDFPLLLLLDDLQWADMGTVSLLFHLARNLQQSQIVIIGAFRRSEVMAPRHPLEGVYFELQRLYGDVELALDAADGQTFVEDLLDRQPNHFDIDFRYKIYQYTQGNALFTIELLHSMQERGALLRGEDGNWKAGATLDWNTLPPRIEGVIAQRISRLPEELREALTFASIEGESFHAEVVAAVQQIERRQMVRWFSSELDRQHGLVVLQGIEQIGAETVACYRFRHILFQKYLYHRLDTAERTHLHGMVGSALEAIYHDQPELIETLANELARHYEESRQWLKAAEWLLVSGKRAYRASSLQTAVSVFFKGIEYAKHSKDSLERDKLELQLQIALGVALMTTRGYNVPEVIQCYSRAEELCRQVGEVTELFNVLRGLCAYYRLKQGLHASEEIGKQMIRIMENHNDSTMQIEAHASLGSTLVYMGNFSEAYYQLSKGVEIANRRVESSLYLVFGQDSTVFCYSHLAWVLWLKGYPDQSGMAIQTALALARQIKHPNSLAFALACEAILYVMCRDPIRAGKAAAELVEVANSSGHTFWIAWSTVQRSWVETELGELNEGIAMLRANLPDDPRLSTTSALTWQFAVYASQLAKTREFETAIRGLNMTIEYGDMIGEHWWEAELYRLRGKLLLLNDQELALETVQGAEDSFVEAMRVAQKQEAKSWELRATTSLAKLWQRQGKYKDALDLLAPIYAWFTEGFDTYDLQKAKRLLQELGDQCK